MVSGDMRKIIVIIKYHLKYLRRIRHFFWRIKVKATAKSVGKRFLVLGKSSVNSQTVIGDYSSFNGMTIKGTGSVSIGSYFHSGEGCLIITANHNYRGSKLPYDEANVVRNVVIEDFVWFGDRVIVLGGVTIGEGAIIQAGSVVNRNIPRCAIAGGNPITVFKMRDVAHFDQLKREGKFYAW